MALILGIDTSGAQGSVILSEGGVVISQQSLPQARQQASVLQPVIAEVMVFAGRNLARLEAVSIVAGPGSYTGLRVGLAAAKGLCFALDIPLLMPSLLGLLALHYKLESVTQNTWVLVPARTGEWFAGCYCGSKNIITPQHWEEAALRTAIAETVVTQIITTSSSSAIKERLSVLFKGILHADCTLNTDIFASESEYRFVNKMTENIINAIPLYLKPPFTTIPTVNRP